MDERGKEEIHQIKKNWEREENNWGGRDLRICGICDLMKNLEIPYLDIFMVERRRGIWVLLVFNFHGKIGGKIWKNKFQRKFGKLFLYSLIFSQFKIYFVRIKFSICSIYQSLGFKKLNIKPKPIIWGG